MVDAEVTPELLELKLDDDIGNIPQKPVLKATLSQKVEQIVTDPYPLTRYIMQEQRKYSDAKGDLTILLNSIQLACKLISVTAKGFGIHRSIYMDDDSDDDNSDDSDVDDAYKKHIRQRSELTRNEMKAKLKKLNILANKYMMECLRWTGIVGLMASEETENQVLLGIHDENKNNDDNGKNDDDENGYDDQRIKKTKYCVVFDPLDGFSNIDANASVGTIFGIYKLKQQGKPAVTDLLQSGKELVCSGYAMYGKATIMVLTFGNTVEGFTLDPTIGEFIHTHRDIKCPKTGTYYSINEGYMNEFDSNIQDYINTKCKKSKKMRYVGSMVSDVHRTLLYGGVFMYPKTKLNPDGKLRILYELNPLSFIINVAGGKSINGRDNILELKPKKVNDTSPVFMGSYNDVNDIQKMYQNTK